MANNREQWTDEEARELKKVFYTQAYELVDELQDAMLKLEADPGDDEILKTVKRHVHTLKGDSNSIGITSIGTLCHRMEDVLSSLMGGPGRGGHEAVDLLLGCIDTIQHLLAQSESGEGNGSAGEIMEKIDLFLTQGPHVSHSIHSINPDRVIGSPLTEYEDLQIQDALKSGLHVYEVEVVFHPQCGEKGVAAFMVAQRCGGMGRVLQSTPDIESGEVEKADRIRLLFATKLSADAVRKDLLITGITSDILAKEHRGEERVTEPGSSGPSPAHTAPASSEMLRVDASRVDKIMDLVGELIINRSMIDQLTRELEGGASMNDAAARLSAVNSFMERTVSDLQRGVMKMRMVPIHHVFRKFPKLVRDLSLEKGKRVRLDVQGKDTELDKGIVDSLGEPLAHLIRNMIDHGIEDPAARRSAGKPEEGIIALKAYHESAQIVIEASDDGCGINTEKLRQKALEKGFLSPGEAKKLSHADAVNLAFISGLSTVEAVSETSGRGVGMDVVKTAVENMKGSIEIETAPGAGTRFRLRLPLTLAVIRALLFEVNGRLYALPVSAVAEVTRVMADALITVDGRKTLMLRNQVISIISLHELFRVGDGGQKKKFVLILGLGGRRAGLLIDRLVGQQELVIKAVDERHARSDLIAGASILGSGKVVLILDAFAVFRKAVEEEKRKETAA